MPGNKDHRNVFRSMGLCFVLPMLLAVTCVAGCSGRNLGFASKYQAVFLDNGRVFFGKLSDRNSAFITLKDVYYIQTVSNQDKKGVKNLLVPLKEGNEWHNPSFIRININHVVMIEPVGAASNVARLIRESKEAPLLKNLAPATPPKAESSAPAAPPKMESSAPAPNRHERPSRKHR